MSASYRHSFEATANVTSRPGAFVITFGLPLLMYTFTFFCNDTTGCPVPSLLSPSTLTLKKLKEDAGWPVNGIWGLCNWEVFLKVCGYYVWSIALYFILPGDVREGQPLALGGARLKYKFNSKIHVRAVLTIAKSS